MTAWKIPLVPFAAVLGVLGLFVWIFLVLLPCEICCLGLYVLGEPERGDAFMGFAMGMLP